MRPYRVFAPVAISFGGSRKVTFQVTSSDFREQRYILLSKRYPSRKARWIVSIVTLLVGLGSKAVGRKALIENSRSTSRPLA